MRRAIFLDRDGVINLRKEDYVLRWDEFAFLPETLPSLAKLAQLSLPIVVITNQSAVGRGLLTLSELEAIHRAMVTQIAKVGGRIDRIYVCSHHPEDKCSCRKPKPGLLLKAAEEMNLCLRHSYLIGDEETDIQAALAVGCRAIRIATGLVGALWEETQKGLPVTFPDLRQAVDWIYMVEDGLARWSLLDQA